jgi:ferritin-like protein
LAAFVCGKILFTRLKGEEMNSIEKIQQEYKAASGKKQELAEKLRKLEETEPDNFHQLWIMRDQIAYWEGKSEGLQFALEELRKGDK